MKKAFITGISGQDGSYLAELLLEKGYEVHGMIRRNSNFEFIPNINHIRSQLHLHYGDMTDGAGLRKLIMDIRPDEVYNLAAQSHVAVSFEVPVYTAETDGLGVLNMLEAVRALVEDQRKNNETETRFYQASTSEMFGKVQETPQKETTAFYPRSPYGVAKLYAHWITVNYRESYGLHASCGILFNHESPRRGETFVTRKITKGLAELFVGRGAPIQLGNLDAKRDWGHAKDFVEGMWLMLQQETPDDYVLATGEQYSIREFLDMCLNWYKCSWGYFGSGASEYVIDLNGAKQTIAQVNLAFYRPAEVSTLLGDSTKAREKLGWAPKYDIEALVTEMCEADALRSGYKRPW